jgi:hypothetical protein
VLLFWLTGQQAAAFDQTWRLQPGWQAIFLEVDPADRRPEAVFRDLQVEGVWAWPEAEARIDFLLDPAEPLQQRERWLAWHPSNRPESRGNTLTEIQAGKPYLVRVVGGRDSHVFHTRKQNGLAVAITNIFWRVTGRPVLPQANWPGQAYSLRGVSVDDGGTTPVAAFFGASPAHFDTTLRRPHGVWTLEPNGHWRSMQADEPLIRGVAYWIRTESPTEYRAPLQLDGAESVFGTQSDRMRLTLKALDGLARVVSVVRLDSASGPLMLARNLGGQKHMGPAPALSGIALRPATPGTYELVADRSRQESDLYETVYVIRDNRGSQYHLPVRVERAP